MEEKAHAKLGASSMHRWAECPGSIRLCEGIVSPTSVYAQDGTRAHELGAKMLSGDLSISEIDGFDIEMLNAVSVYTEYANKLINEDNESIFHVEHKFDLSKIHEDMFGTCDLAIYKPKTKKLYVLDYKHGVGVPIEIEGNKQLQFYALGALLSLGFKVETVEMVIVQPRCLHVDGPIRSWCVDVKHFKNFKKELIEAARRTEDPNAPLVSGSHCRFCPAAAICPELTSKAHEVVKSQFDVISNYDQEKLSKSLSIIPVLESWIKSVKEFAQRELESGNEISGWKLVPKRPMRKWRDEVSAAQELELNFKIAKEDLFEKKLKSPTQIEKYFKKENLDFFDKLVFKESSGTTLVPASDKRTGFKDFIKTQFTVIND